MPQEMSGRDSAIESLTAAVSAQQDDFQQLKDDFKQLSKKQKEDIAELKQLSKQQKEDTAELKQLMRELMSPPSSANGVPAGSSSAGPLASSSSANVGVAVQSSTSTSEKGLSEKEYGERDVSSPIPAVLDQRDVPSKSPEERTISAVRECGPSPTSLACSECDVSPTSLEERDPPSLEERVVSPPSSDVPKRDGSSPSSMSPSPEVKPPPACTQIGEPPSPVLFSPGVYFFPCKTWCSFSTCSEPVFSSSNRSSPSLKFGMRDFLVEDLDLWRRRMRHMSKRGLKRIPKCGLVDGFDLSGNTISGYGFGNGIQAKIKRDQVETSTC